jgi:uncharacterized protein YndB with AHSA1/START domain
MTETFVARVSVTINASRAKVWDALVTPGTIKQYLPVTEVVSDWREGRPIFWRSEFQSKPFEIRGTILRLESGRVLEYDHSRPIFRPSRDGRALVTYQRVTIELGDEGPQTRVSVTERDNKTEPELAHSEGGWRLALGNMKALLEGTSIAPLR